MSAFVTGCVAGMLAGAVALALLDWCKDKTEPGAKSARRRAQHRFRTKFGQKEARK